MEVAFVTAPVTLYFRPINLLCSTPMHVAFISNPTFMTEESVNVYTFKWRPPFTLAHTPLIHACNVLMFMMINVAKKALRITSDYGAFCTDQFRQITYISTLVIDE